MGLLHVATPGVTFGSDEAAHKNYADEVEGVLQTGAAHDPQWLRLGYYQRRGFIRRLFRSEYRSQADGDLLFLSKTGTIDPVDELRTTLNEFAKPLVVPQGKTVAEAEATHAQCMFPARRNWAFKKLGWEKVLNANRVPILGCELRQIWKKRLDADGVSLVFASAYLNNAGSMFGHTFLKFHSKSNGQTKDLLDYGVSFAAETGSDGGVPFALYGLLGFYVGRFTMQPFHETLRTYSNLEGRDLIEYRIRFTPEELDFFIDHLFELERTHFDYYFLTENCAYFLLAALEVAKPEVSLSDEFWYEVIPADSIRVVARTPGLVESTRYRPSLHALFRAQADRLSKDDIRFARDVVQNGQSENLPELKNASTAALDLALDYGAVRAAGDPAFDKLNHKLRAERAARGGASPITTVKTPRLIEEGHDPARVGILFEMPIGHDSARGRMGLQTRFAYHDRLSNDDGYLRGTSLEVLRMTALTDDRDPSRVRLREIAVLDVFSSQARDAFSKPVSWRASLGVREPLYARSLGPYVSAGAGYTFEFTRYLWLTTLLDAEALFNPDLENNSALYVGPRLLATVFASEKLKIGIDYAMMRPVIPARRYDLFSTEIAWAPLRNLELRVGYTDAQLEGARRSDWNVKIFQHLLF